MGYVRKFQSAFSLQIRVQIPQPVRMQETHSFVLPVGDENFA